MSGDAPRAGVAERVFVCLGTDWGRHPSTMSYLFSVIARQEPVVWVNSIGQRTPSLAPRDLKRVAEKARAALRRGNGRASSVSPDVPLRAVLDPLAVPFHGYGTIRRLNAFLLDLQLRTALATHGRDRSLVLVSSNPAAVSLIPRLAPDLSVYYCMDEYAEMSDSDAATIGSCEPLMLETADLVIATSRALCDRKRGRDGQAALHLPQGVDADHFAREAPCPEPLKQVPRPILGFQGIVGDRVDLDLFERILERFPGVSLVTVGRRERNLSRLRRYPRFFDFGPVSYEALPAWVAQFDVGLINYVQDGHTAAVNPLKLLEYLACGLPVVSTDLPELALHGDMVLTGATPAEYLDQIARVLSSYPFPADRAEERRAYARRHSWEARARRFLEICDDALAARRRDAPEDAMLEPRTGS
ncbi:MAG: glycosyltransferase [Acidiferrobacteraceae bacterium]